MIRPANASAFLGGLERHVNSPAPQDIMDSTVVISASAKMEGSAMPGQEGALAQQEPWERIVKKNVLLDNMALIVKVSAIVVRMENAIPRMVCADVQWVGGDQLVLNIALLDAMVLDVYTPVNARTEGHVIPSVDAVPVHLVIMVSFVKFNALQIRTAFIAKNAVIVRMMPSATMKLVSVNANQGLLEISAKKNVSPDFMVYTAKRNVTVVSLDAML